MAAKKSIVKKVAAAAKPKPVAAAKPKPAAAGYVKRTPLQAAKDLQNYLKQPNADKGTKTKPSAFVLASQRDMGGVTADGIMGAKTQARMTALLKVPAAVAKKPTPKATAATPIAAAAAVAPPAPGPIGAALAVQESSMISSGSPQMSQSEDMSDPPEPAPAFGGAAPSPSPAEVFVPSSIAEEVMASAPDPVTALQEFANTPGGTMADYNALVDALSAKFTPQIKQLATEIEAQALQRQATSEHNALMQETERWVKNNEVQQLIVDKLAELVKVLMANNAVSKRVYTAYGIHL